MGRTLAHRGGEGKQDWRRVAPDRFGSGCAVFAICEENASRIILLDEPPTTCDVNGGLSCGPSAPSLPGDGTTYYFLLCGNSPGVIGIAWLPEEMADRC